MQDNIWCSLNSVDGPGDQILSWLYQNLDPYVVRYQLVVDDEPHEVEIRLTSWWEPDLDLLEAHLEQVEIHPQLLVMVHRVDERLIAVTQIDAYLLKLLVRNDILLNFCPQNNYCKTLQSERSHFKLISNPNYFQQFSESSLKIA